MNTSIRNCMLSLAVLVLVFLAFPSHTVAQWSSDPSVNSLVCDTTGDQATPKIAATKDGGFYIAWFDQRNGNYSVYAQRLNAQGVKQWAPNGLLVSNNTQSSSLVDWDIAVDDSNYLIVAFTDMRNGSTIEPFAYRISPQGAEMWGANGVGLSTTPTVYQANPRIVCTSDGNYVFAWIYTSTPRKVAMQKLNNAGAKQWGNDPMYVSGTGAELLDYPNIVRSDNGNVILEMSGYTGSFLNPGNYHLYTQKYSPAGTPLWTLPYDTLYALGRVTGFFVPKFVPDGNNGAFCVWQDDRNATNTASTYVQHLTSADAKLFPVNGSQASTLAGRLHSDGWPAYSPSKKETFVFWYETDASTQGVYAVYGQKFDSLGTRLWPDTGKAIKPFDQNQPSFIRSFAKDTVAIVTYSEGQWGTANNLIKAFEIDRNGRIGNSGSLVVLSSFLSSKIRPLAAINQNYMLASTWSDQRSGSGGIYAQNMNFDGTLGVQVTIKPTVYSVSRNLRVPNVTDSVTVTARIIDSSGTGITADSLMYKLNGGTAVKVALPRISGSNTDGVYSGVIPVSANANGNRVEYQVMAVNAAGTTTTAVAAANSYFAGITPMSPTGLRYEDSLYASPYKGYYARVSGTVNGPNWQAANLSTYIQDAVGGLNLYKSGALTAIRNLGDSVTVLGKLDQYRGVTEIVPDSLTDIVTVATGRTVTPIAVTVTQYNTTPELYESRLIKFTSLNRKYSTPVWPPAATAATIIMQQTGPSDTVTMYINAGTNIPGSTEPTYPVNMACVGTQFASTGAGTQGGYEVLPRYVTDFTSNAPLSGNYTIGAAGQFPTLDSAFAVLATVGVSGPVTLTLSDSVYAAPDRPAGTSVSRLASSRTAVLDDADPLSRYTTPNVTNGTDAPTTAGITVVGPIPGASATNRITVKPATGVKARISGTGSATFLFQNVSYVTFDGVGTTGTTQLTIENTATNGIAIALLGGCRNDVAKNLTIRSVYASGVGVYMDTASGAAPDSNTVMNNLIPSSQYGVYARGGNYIAHGNQILGNTIGSDSIGAVGVYNQQVAGSVIANNTIRNVKDAVAAGGNIAGIWVATKQLNMRVYNNVINGVKNRSTATAAVFAAGVYHFGTAGDTTRSKYYNNMVTGLDNPSTSTSATVRGMYLSTAIKDTAAYNSVYLTGTDGAAILSGALYMSSASVGLTLKDNIGINARIATGRAMAFYATGAPSSLVSNYNDLYVPTQTNSNVAAVGATNYATLAAWQATGQDSQSVNVMANFRTPDLHIDSTIATSIYGHGTPVAGVTTDIDGQVRNATTPCIGADEFLQGTPPPPGWSVQTSGVTNYLYSVKAVSQTVAWAAGAGGTVLKTVNSGQNWTSVGGGRIGTADIYNIDAVDGNTALVTTSPAATYIFRTTNGGTTWDTVYTLAGGFIDAIHMIDANNGIALGDPVSSKWTVAKTTNGGATWARITTEPAQVGGEAGTQNGLSMVGGNNIWFNSGVGGRIYRSTDGGATWSSGVASFAATSNVWFTTALNGVATGSSASQVARSTDGGATWTTVTTSGSGFLIACAGSGTTDFWYAQGSVIYRSTNKGQTWTTSYTGVGTYVGLSFATTGGSTYGWAVSDSARIVAFNGTVTDVKDQQATEVPTTFALQQNYPNPFNPTTTIRYGLPEASKVALSIYNVLGQKIATLTNDVQGAGFYNVVWNGHNDAGTQVASGIYFFRLEATPTGGGAPFSGMKKMVMLK